MYECTQHEELKVDMQNAKLVVGWHNGISGKSAMISGRSVEDVHADIGLKVVTYPVVIEGTTTPLCFTSWTYDHNDQDGYDKALAICIEQAELIVSKFNR